MARGTADTSLTKPGYAKVAYTEETLRDFRNCFDPVTGPLYFMVNHMRIQHPTKGEIPFIPFDYQIDLIQNYNENRNSINMLGRQMGKCLSGKHTNIKIRNKKTGEIKEITIEEFHNLSSEHTKKDKQ